MSLKKYRIVDLFILAIIMTVLEVICIVFSTLLNAFFVLSLATVFVLIVMMRWSAFGLIHAVLSGVVFALTENYLAKTLNTSIDEIVVYGIGNSFIAVELLLFKFIGKEKICKGNWYLVLYAFVGYVSVCLGRAVMGIFFDVNFFSGLLQQFTTEALDFVFSIIILFITNRQEGMFCDQKKYFNEVRLGGKDE